jgi:hypothetical protein
MESESPMGMFEHYIVNGDFYQILEGGSANNIEMQCHLGLNNVKVSKPLLHKAWL